MELNLCKIFHDFVKQINAVHIFKYISTFRLLEFMDLSLVIDMSVKGEWPSGLV